MVYLEKRRAATQGQRPVEPEVMMESPTCVSKSIHADFKSYSFPGNEPSTVIQHSQVKYVLVFDRRDPSAEFCTNYLWAQLSSM